MIALAGLTSEVLAGAPRWGCKISSWLGSTFLRDVPIVSGKLTSKTTTDVLHTLSITVRRFDHGFDWRPGSDPLHPLARYGQELDVSVLVGSAVSDQVWTVRKARVLITDWDDDDNGNVVVTGESRLRRIKDDRPAVPLVPATGGTLASEALRILPPGMGLAVDATLADRAVPSTMVWGTDRLAALQDIATAWPALLRVDTWGQIVMAAPLPQVPTPVLTLTDGKGGTVVAVPRSDTRSGSANRIVARSSASGAEDVQAVAEQATGPMAVTGPYGAVTTEWSSPLLGNVAQAQAAAATMLARSLVSAAILPVVHAPDPRLELDDPVAVVRRGEPLWGWVTGTELPLTVSDIGSGQRTDVGVGT
ncbi:MAG: hypothetical protein BGO37_10670 [Cellulomonas sp. 73-92]|uniref:hypothetical protein n=1 Tax=Cellulomonas sp. 73-92 TaxID=1895740 RepID=UPI000929DA44|nr:hypothetical protein [Cellulomonas sp. 73-92]OJV76512.1 MAG: hypothetical protein BGO37_10670 [Cellulomonas sp. 73-92]